MAAKVRKRAWRMSTRLDEEALGPEFVVRWGVRAPSPSRHRVEMTGLPVPGPSPYDFWYALSLPFLVAAKSPVRFERGLRCFVVHSAANGVALFSQ